MLGRRRNRRQGRSNEGRIGVEAIGREGEAGDRSQGRSGGRGEKECRSGEEGARNAGWGANRKAEGSGSTSYPVLLETCSLHLALGSRGPGRPSSKIRFVGYKSVVQNLARGFGGSTGFGFSESSESQGQKRRKTAVVGASDHSDAVAV
jgi:hypothetical protein